MAFQVAAAWVAVSYAVHWWQAAHPSAYPTSARLIEWLEPAPGKWLSLTLEAALALLALLVGGVCSAAGFQAWNGHRFSRWVGLLATAAAVGFTAAVNWWAAAAAGLALVGAVLLFVPKISEHFTALARHRERKVPVYRRPETVFYGRLPRYR